MITKDMKPLNELELFTDDGYFWIDVVDSTEQCQRRDRSPVSVAATERAAWRKAAQRLKRLAREAERNAERVA